LFAKRSSTPSRSLFPGGGTQQDLIGLSHRAARANRAVNSKVIADGNGSNFLSRAASFLRTSRSLLEAAAAGIAYGALLCWVSTCMVASFRGAYLTSPYWSDIPALRTDTCGAISFAAAAVGLMVSEYLRLRRRDNGKARPRVTRDCGPMQPAAQAASETIAVLSTVLVAYISANAITHPVTLGIHATHFASWPTEGTLRVLALFGCVASVGALRYMQARQHGASSPTFGSAGFRTNG
jgi:hypothetical protein